MVNVARCIVAARELFVGEKPFGFELLWLTLQVRVRQYFDCFVKMLLQCRNGVDVSLWFLERYQVQGWIPKGLVLFSQKIAV